VHYEDDGSLWAEVLELPGLFASGFSEAELEEALTEAIGLYLSDDDHTVEVQPVEDGKPLEAVKRREFAVC